MYSKKKNMKHNSDEYLDTLSDNEVHKRQDYNILILSWGFCFVVCGLKLVGSFGTPLLGNMGALSLAFLMYGGAISCLIGPSIMDFIPSSEIGLRIFGPEYAIYILTFVYYIPVFCVTWSAIHGLSASLFWTCEVIILKENSTIENVGRKSNLFWGIYMSGSIVGNLIAYFVLNILGYEIDENQTGWLGSVSIMFSVFVVFSIIGSFFFYFFKPLPQGYRRTNKSTISFTKRLYAVCKAFITPRILCVIPIAIAWGYSLPFVNTMFNRQVVDRSTIGLLTAFISLIEVLFSLITGRVIDLLGINYALLITTVSMILGLIISYFASIQQNWLLYLSCFFFAIADTGYQTILPVLITHFKDEVIANAVIRFVFNLVGGICSNIATLFVDEGKNISTNEQYLTEIIIAILIAVIGQIFYNIYHHFYPVPESLMYSNKVNIESIDNTTKDTTIIEVEMKQSKIIDENKNNNQFNDSHDLSNNNLNNEVNTSFDIETNVSVNDIISSQISPVLDEQQSTITKTNE